MKEGNGDPSLVLFGENSTPNLHKLAREFVLLDNFYVNSDVSADGHNWSTAAIAPDYVQKMWPNKYANRRTTYDFEEQDAASLPPAGYLWTNAAAAGVSLRNFGYMVNNKPNAPLGAEQITGVRDPVLAKVTNPMYRGFDLNYPDVERAKVFLAELAEYEKSGNMPRLIVMRLGNDHTSGTAAGKIAPLSAAADNDYAVGQLVEGVSKSRFWNSTAIFILEDDAQNGPDHVDSHRSPGLPHFPLGEAPRRGQQHVQHHLHAAHHRIPAWIEADDALRCRRAPHDRRLPGPAQPGPVHRGETAHFPRRKEPRRHRGRGPRRTPEIRGG